MLSDRDLAYRVRILPSQLERARRRHSDLVAEAKRLRMTDILTNLERLDQAWEREVLGAKLDAAEQGGDTSMGIDGL